MFLSLPSTVSQPARRQPLIQSMLLALVILWCAALLIPPTWLADAGLSLNAHGHQHVYAHGHPFVDARSFGGIPNAMDVLSNLPFLLAGIWGLRLLRHPGNAWVVENRSAASVFFVGLCLTALGSATYHWAPNAWTLVGDRLGMAVSFAGAMGLVLAHRADRSTAQIAMWGMLLLAAVSSAMPAVHDQVLPWAVVQFGGVALILVAAAVRPDASKPRLAVGALIALYLVAKLLEMGDAWAFEATGHWISGHSLKHLVAAMAAWPVCAAIVNRFPAKPQAECA
ncbi:hypothetical protein [Hydrogenophaga sp. 5NK40-0174]|uniref:hypothetical protein n=1 Tax=Hydrogenophaga sp. 5NK40-0174 TaxID=3127649 RepID=UPI0031049677